MKTPEITKLAMLATALLGFAACANHNTNTAATKITDPVMLKKVNDASKTTLTNANLEPNGNKRVLYSQIASQVGVDSIGQATLTVVTNSDNTRNFQLEIKVASATATEKFTGAVQVITDSRQFADITLDDLASAAFVSETSIPQSNSCVDIHFNADGLTKRSSTLKSTELVLCLSTTQD